MVEVEQMPYNEKLEGIFGFTRLVEDFATQLVSEELGQQKALELQSIWKKESEPIPKVSSDKDKYEVAYRNFGHKWVSANNFMGTHQGEDGINKFMQAAIAAWNRRYALRGLMFKVVGGISRRNTFRIVSKGLAYQLQAFSPFVVTELNEKRMVLSVAPCKILADQNGANFCSMACQNIIPSWLEKQFNVKMNLTRQGENCSVIFEAF